MKPIKTIVVVGTQRSGTTWIMQVLSQYEGFRVYGEVFREIHSDEFKGDPALKPPQFYLEYCENHSKNPLKFVNETLRENGKITVIKLMYDQIRRAPELLKLISNPNVLVINVERENIYEVALSKCIARKTGIYHSSTEQNVEQFELSYSFIYKLMLKEKLKKLVFPSTVKVFAKNYHYFSYEELLKDFYPLEKFIDSNINLAEFSFDFKKTKWKKTEKNKKHSTIVNLDLIRKKLKKSMFKGYVS